MYFRIPAQLDHLMCEPRLNEKKYVNISAKEFQYPGLGVFYLLYIEQYLSIIIKRHQNIQKIYISEMIMEFQPLR
jgi:hypothetical protein